MQMYSWSLLNQLTNLIRDTPYPDSLSQATFSADKITSEISLTLAFNSDLYFSLIKLQKETLLFCLPSKQALLNFAQCALT
jgi:hypothetical protein